jgi:hypothetical protein
MSWDNFEGDIAILPPPTRKRKKLYEHQENAIRKMMSCEAKRFKCQITDDSGNLWLEQEIVPVFGKIELPMGAGKTIIAL